MRPIDFLEILKNGFRTRLLAQANSDIDISLPSSPGTLSRIEDLRPKATSEPIFYVSTTGSDSNDGLTVGTAFATLQKAIDVLSKIDCNGFNPRIILATPGAYDQPIGGLQLKNTVGVGQRITIEGSASNRTDYKIRGTNPSPNFDGRGVVCVSNTLYKFVGVEFGWNGNQSDTYHKIFEVITPVELEDCCIRGNTAQMDGLSAYGSTTIRLLKSIQIEGTFRFVFDVNNAFLYIENVVFSGTATFSDCFTGSGGIVLGYAPSVTGSFTGRKFNLSRGYLETYGSGATPGDTAGVYV